MPFSSIASLKTFVALFPFTEGPVSSTLSLILGGRFKERGSLL